MTKKIVIAIAGSVLLAFAGCLAVHTKVELHYLVFLFVVSSMILSTVAVLLVTEEEKTFDFYVWMGILLTVPAIWWVQVLTI